MAEMKQSNDDSNVQLKFNFEYEIEGKKVSLNSPVGVKGKNVEISLVLSEVVAKSKNTKKKRYLEVINRVLYVLELENGCFYIGQAQKNRLDKRMNEHFNLERKSRKSAWVALNKAVNIKEVIEYDNMTVPEVEIYEDQKTIEYMKSYGIDKVRGGHYCVTDYAEIVKCLKAHGHVVIGKHIK